MYAKKQSNYVWTLPNTDLTYIHSAYIHIIKFLQKQGRTYNKCVDDEFSLLSSLTMTAYNSCSQQSNNPLRQHNTQRNEEKKIPRGKNKQSVINLPSG